MVFIRKDPKDKEKKQLDMVKLETRYVQFLSKKISKKRDVLLAKNPKITTVFEGWLYGIYIAILDNQHIEEQKGKLYYLFENTAESENKYKLSYIIDDKNNCVFNGSELKKFPKHYISILKRHHFDITKSKLNVSELISAHNYNLDESVYIHHSDYNKLNNSIKNLVPLDKDFFNGLNDNEQKNIAKSQQFIPDKYKIEQRKKPKDIVKMEYRACDLYYNHHISIEKIASTLRNRMNKATIQRTIKLYPYFKVYCLEEKDK